MSIVQEFRLKNSDIYELCDRIKAMFPDALFAVTGDATGHNRSALAKGNINYYLAIRERLNLAPGQMKQPAINPAVSDSRVILNSILQNGNLLINPERCPYLVQDLISVEVDDKGDIDKSKDKYKSHLLDCFIAETPILTLIGWKPIAEIKSGEMVLTSCGYKKVTDSFSRGVRDVYEFTFSDGRKLVCTKEHKIYTDIGYVPILYVYLNRIKTACTLSITAENTQKRKGSHTINVDQVDTSIHGIYIDKYGLITLEKYRKTLRFITKIMIRLTIGLRILKYLLGRNIKGIIQGYEIKSNFINLRLLDVNMLRHGIQALKEFCGIKNMPLNLISGNLNTANRIVRSAERNILRNPIMPDFAAMDANLNTEEDQALILKKGFVSGVVKYIELENTYLENIAGNHALLKTGIVIEKVRYLGRNEVFDISVQDCHEFYANGILSHNCLRYYLSTFHGRFVTG